MQSIVNEYFEDSEDDDAKKTSIKTVSSQFDDCNVEKLERRVVLPKNSSGCHILFNQITDGDPSNSNDLPLSSNLSSNHGVVGHISRSENSKKSGKGFVSQSTIGAAAFQEQLLTFDRFGYSLDVHGNVIGDRARHTLLEGSSVFSLTKNQQHDLSQSKQSRKRKLNSDDIPVSAVQEFIPPAEELVVTQIGSVIALPTFQFHSTSEWPQPVNYLGKSFLHVSHRSQLNDNSDSYIPTRCISQSPASSKNNRVISLNPVNNRLVLSGCLNGSCQLYHLNSSNNLELLASYLNHASTCIKVIQHSPNGKSFMLASYLTQAKVVEVSCIDVESGLILHSSNHLSVINCIQFASDSDVLTACDNGKVLQYDLTSSQGLQTSNLEYNYHNAPVTSIQLFDNGNKFASFSQDRKVLVWELYTPVPVQYISEAYLSSITMTSISINSEIIAGSSNSGVYTFQTTERGLRPLRKKVFRGHLTSGFACQAALSPNLKYLASGDGLGDLTFWDWKTKKVFRKLHAHDGGPCACSIWHPDGEIMFTCGWDGVIKVWD